jgi:rhodanese-related sulfurtransferase
MIRPLIAVALIATALVPSAWAPAQTYPPAVTALVARAKSEVRTIDMAAFKAAVDQRAAGLIVDVREPAEYAEGHIAGAINVPRGLVELRIWPHVGYPAALDMTKRMTLYCASGTRCVLAAKSLQDLGFTDVTAVDMRLEDWSKAGYHLVK